MKIIVGLGNPGEKYLKSRHNVGFMVVDRIVQSSKFKVQSCNLQFKMNKKFNAEILNLKSYNLDLILVKPQTFMNDSGMAVANILRYYDIKDYKNLYVIHDDLDIVLGEYKIQFGRSAAGHHGVESIINHLGTKDFWRARIGIDNSEFRIQNSELNVKDYVLESFNKEEQKIMDNVINKTVGELTHALSQP